MFSSSRMANDKNPQDESVDDETKAISVPDAGDSGEGKLKMIVSLVKKCLGVKDIASMYALCLSHTPIF